MSPDSRARMALLSTLFSFMVPMVSQAAEPTTPTPERTLTLRDAVSQALRQNPQLSASVSDVRIAEARVVEARGAEDFVLGSSASWLATRGQDIPGLILDDALFGASLTRLLPTGGTLSLRLDTEYTRSASLSAGGEDATQVYQPSAILSVTHPLLRGFGTDVARAPRRRARVGLDQATLQREAAAADLLRSTAQTYWELAFATTQLRVRRSSLDLAREQLRAVRANIDVGKQPPSAAAEVEVTIALREDEVFQAEQLARERSLELQQLLGIESGPDTPTLLAEDTLQPQFIPHDVRAAIEQAKQHNPQLAAARTAGAAAAIDVDVTRNGLLPQLDFAVGGGPLGSASSAAFTNFVGGYTVQAGLTFSFPIERNTANGQYAAAQEGLRKARLSADAISIQVAAGVTRAMHIILLAEKRVGVLARATELAALDLEAERARFLVGRSSNFDVLRRQDELARAQLQQARAKTDYLKGEALLDSLTSEIFPKLGVELRRGSDRFRDPDSQERSPGRRSP